MWRHASGADHYDLRAWVGVGEGISGSDVDAAGAGFSNRRVGGYDIVRLGGSTDRISRKVDFTSTAQPKLSLLAGPPCNKRKASHTLFLSFPGPLGLLRVAILTCPLPSKFQYPLSRPS